MYYFGLFIQREDVFKYVQTIVNYYNIGGCLKMKHFNFKKMLMMLALVIVVENGAVIASNVDGNTDAYTEDGGVAPCSDMPSLDEDYN